MVIKHEMCFLDLLQKLTFIFLTEKRKVSLHISGTFLREMKTAYEMDERAFKRSYSIFCFSQYLQF